MWCAHIFVIAHASTNCSVLYYTVHYHHHPDTAQRERVLQIRVPRAHTQAHTRAYTRALHIYTHTFIPIQPEQAARAHAEHSLDPYSETACPPSVSHVWWRVRDVFRFVPRARSPRDIVHTQTHIHTHTHTNYYVRSKPYKIYIFCSVRVYTSFEMFGISTHLRQNTLHVACSRAP